MPFSTTLSRHSGARSAHFRRVLAGGLALLGVTAGCSDFARLVTPGSEGGVNPALVSLSASVASSVGSAGDVVTLRVVAQYLRRDGTAVRIGTQTLPLSTSATQQVPIPVELAPCLADADRDQPGGQKNACNILLNLALVVNDVVVDEQVVGPIQLAPGATAPVAQQVSLFEIAGIEVAVGDGPVVSPTEEVTAILGGGLTLKAQVRDKSGVAVVDRTVTWSSDAPAIATIGAASGVVAALGVGTVHVTASIGTISRTVAVRVARAPAALTVVPNQGSGDGVVRSTPAGIDCRVSGLVVSGACAFTFPGDATVLLSSTPNQGSVFDSWGEECVGSSAGAVCSVTMSQPRTTSARFTALRRLVVVADGGDGAGRVTAGAAGLDCRVEAGVASGTCAVDVPDGVSVALVATPDAASPGKGAQSFGGWGGACSSALGMSCGIVTSGTIGTVSVRFHDEQQLHVSVDGIGSGQVVWSDGATCARANGTTTGTCARSSVYGTEVTLNAVADVKSAFSGWVGDCDTQVATMCVTTLTRSKNVTATFGSVRRITIAVSSGDGRGRVTGASGVNCSIHDGQATGVCSVDVPDGTNLVLTAVAEAPAPGSSIRQMFGGWEGACAAESGASCTVVAAGGDRTVYPRFFDARQVKLSMSGNGIGRVLWEDGAVCALSGGIQSGSCEQVGVYGSTVSLTAAADPLSTFNGWSGECDQQVGATCITTLTKSRSVTATFAKKRVALTLTLSGAASGSVLVDSQSACTLGRGQTTVTCIVQYDIGTPITLSAAAASGARFTGFGGGCAGVACSLILTAPMAVTAGFDPQQFLLTLQLTGAGAGDVTLGGAPFCSLARDQKSATCTRMVDVGTSVQLAATPAVGATFTGLGGDCANANPCSLQVSRDLNVSGTFDNVATSLAVVMLGPGDGTVTSSSTIGCTRTNGLTSGKCAETLAWGSVITLTATSVNPSWLVKWGGACAAQAGPTCSITLTKDLTVGVGFDKSQ